MHTHVLIVEDNPDIQRLLLDTLREFSTHAVDSVSDVIDYLQSNTPDLAIVDLRLADGNGMTLAKYIRRNHPYIVVIILTATGNMNLAIEALEAGVHAFLLKPILPNELKTKINEQLEKMQEIKQRDMLAANMRQAISGLESFAKLTIKQPAHELIIGRLYLNRERYEVKFNDSEIPFSPVQFRILWLLVQKQGEIISASNIVQEALGYDVDETEATNLIKGHISKIRSKIAPYYKDNEEKIRNVRHIGYGWVQ